MNPKETPANTDEPLAIANRLEEVLRKDSSVDTWFEDPTEVPSDFELAKIGLDLICRAVRHDKSKSVREAYSAKQSGNANPLVLSDSLMDTGRLGLAAAETQRNANPNTTEPLQSEQIVDPLTRVLPKRIGRFEIVRELGKGGFGIVLLGRDPELGRMVAVKIPRLEMLIDEDARRRFSREAYLVSTLSHPAIVPVYEYSAGSGVPFIAFAWCRGTSLADWLLRHDGNISPQLAAKIVRQLAGAIQYAHQRDVVHRDLKPGNILLDWETDQLGESASPESGEELIAALRITDFGLAKSLQPEAQRLTRDGAMVGTPSYMAPEQFSGKTDASASADIYALGAILYELLTGSPPLRRDTDLATMRAVESEEPVPPSKVRADIPTDLEAICLKCLEKNPNHRYGSGYDLQTDLQQFLEGRPVSARRITTMEKSIRWCRRNPVFAGLTASTTAAVTFAVLASWIGWYSTTAALKREQQANQVSIQRLSQLQTKSRELTSVIERLFIGLATSPEVQRESADQLRHTLLTEANQFYESFLSAQPEDDELRLEHARTLFHLAEINSALGDLNQAVRYAREAIDEGAQLQTNCPTLEEQFKWQAFVARMMFRSGFFEVAQKEFELAEQKMGELSQVADAYDFLPMKASFLASRADHLLLAGKPNDSRQLAEQARSMWQMISDIGGETSLHENNYFEQGLATFVIAESLQVTGKLAEAQEEYQQANELFAQASQSQRSAEGVVHAWSRCLRGQGINWAIQQQFDKARESYLSALNMLNPQQTQHPLFESLTGLACSIRYSLAATEASLSNWPAVENILLTNIEDQDRRMELFPDLRSTICNSQGENYNLLHFAYSKWDQRNVDDQAKAIEQAIDWYRQSIHANPDWTRPQMALARAENNHGNLAYRADDLPRAEQLKLQALQGTEELLKQQPDWAEAQLSLGHILASLARIYSEQNRLEEAISLCDQMLQSVPNHPQLNEVLVERVRLLARAANFDEAYHALEEYSRAHARNDADYIGAVKAALFVEKIAFSAATDAEDRHVESETPDRRAVESTIGARFKQFAITVAQTGADKSPNGSAVFVESMRTEPELIPIAEILNK